LQYNSNNIKTKEQEHAWKVTTTSPDAAPVLVQTDAGRQVPGRNLFRYDAVFQGSQSTSEVYQSLAKPVVDAVVTGRHGTVFAYGQTGSGKTHTMQGSHPEDHSCGSEDAHGIVQLAAMDMLEQMERGDDREYVLKAQFFEIYNEQVRDLLPSSDTKDDMTALTIREDKDRAGCTSVSVNAHQENVQSVADIEALLKRGNRNRSCGATSLNARSSRSHAIFRLTLESHSKDPTDAKVRKSVLNLVDLAGSENSAQAKITGIRKKEAGKINQRYVTRNADMEEWNIASIAFLHDLLQSLVLVSCDPCIESPSQETSQAHWLP
jgi:centromeric protein E